MRLTDLILDEDIEWVRVPDLRPSDRQLFAGRLLTVAIVMPYDKLRTRVMYDEAPERIWGNAVQVQRLHRDDSPPPPPVSEGGETQ